MTIGITYDKKNIFLKKCLILSIILAGCGLKYKQSENLRDVFLDNQASFSSVRNTFRLIKEDDGIRQIGFTYEGGTIGWINDSGIQEHYTFEDLEDVLGRNHFKRTAEIIQIWTHMETLDIYHISEDSNNNMWLLMNQDCCPSMSLFYSQNLDSAFQDEQIPSIYKDIPTNAGPKDNWVVPLGNGWHLSSIFLGF